MCDFPILPGREQPEPLLLDGFLCRAFCHCYAKIAPVSGLIAARIVSDKGISLAATSHLNKFFIAYFPHVTRLIKELDLPWLRARSITYF